MYFKVVLTLFFCNSVTGLKLNESSEQFDDDEWGMMNYSAFEKRGINIEEQFWSKTEDSSIQSNSTKQFPDRSRSTLFDFVDVWNPYKVARIWNPDTYRSVNISIHCKEHITDYMNGILAGESWALKLIDVNGRYTWGLLSGNHFWLGFVDECRQMQEEFALKREMDDVPPFIVHSIIVNFDLDIHEKLNRSHNIFLGMCLPLSCNENDVEELLYFAQDRSEDDFSRNMRIKTVRTIKKDYSPWEMGSFHILLITFTVVIALVLLGTVYDIFLRYRLLRKEKEGRKIAEGTTEIEIRNIRRKDKREITIAKLWLVKEHSGSIDVLGTNDAPKPITEALVSFSLLLNLSKIFSLDVGADTLSSIHGLRFVSMVWIILVHTCLIVEKYSDREAFRTNAEKSFLYQTIANASYSVDTFFVISGCLVSFLYFRTMAKYGTRKTITQNCHGPVFQFLGMVFYRYFRLTPVYMVTIVLMMTVRTWNYHYTTIDALFVNFHNCDFWWRNVLYLDNIFSSKEMCIPWSWYLASDTQFYTVGIILLILAGSFLPIAIFITTFLLLASWITTAIITINTEHIPSVEDPFATYDSLYSKPWLRGGPYLVGMIAGWYLYRMECKLKINKAVATVCWLLSLSVMLSIIYGVQGTTFNTTSSAMYTSLSHTAWAISVAWILIACSTGHGGMIDKILSWKYLFPFSRLTYCTYLIHPIVIRMMLASGQTSMHLTVNLMGILFAGFTVASYVVALFYSVLFEAPVVSLLRIVHPLRQWKRRI